MNNRQLEILNQITGINSMLEYAPEGTNFHSRLLNDRYELITKLSNVW